MKSNAHSGEENETQVASAVSQPAAKWSGPLPAVSQHVQFNRDDLHGSPGRRHTFPPPLTDGTTRLRSDYAQEEPIIEERKKAVAKARDPERRVEQRPPHVIHPVRKASPVRNLTGEQRAKDQRQWLSSDPHVFKSPDIRARDADRQPEFIAAHGPEFRRQGSLPGTAI